MLPAFRSNCIVTLVLPRVLDEVISVMPAMLPNWRSRERCDGRRHDVGAGPGNAAETEIVGNST